MSEALLTRKVHNDVALLGNFDAPGRVTFAFTERTGGVSQPPFQSLNMGGFVGDDPVAVAENRRRAWTLMGASDYLDNLVEPKQVHGSDLVAITSSSPDALAAARAQALAGADGIICTVPGVPVQLVYADCVPVVLLVKCGFAVVHSGWKGTKAQIAGKAAVLLNQITGTLPQDITCCIGPHIAGCDYQVSEDLLKQFREQFGSMVQAGPQHLSLEAAICHTLESYGVKPWSIQSTGLSTVTARSRFFSWRLEGPVCGRHAALAWMAP